MHPNVEYVKALRFINNSQQSSAPRGMLIREILNYQAQISMRDPVITLSERKLNYKFMLAEALWILRGDNQLAPLTRYCLRMKDFSDNGVTLSGAYGPPFKEQYLWVIDKLQTDIDSRQAVMTFWERCPEPSKDIPCTTALQFLIRNHQLHLNVFMRSWDIWLGMPYDFFSFSMIGTYVASYFPNVEPGQLTVTAGSAHLYDRDISSIDTVILGNHGIKKDIYKYVKYTPDSLINALESNLNALNQ